ncbi:sugar ABC transporter substrate-binding protein [Candidatus Pantoea formicae]|uniref:sugar ABC transporter substrate-binding protein n=1 Tax=Candidatus Pantoea formicae TaxID=2608355 RepID=UPI003ED89871
MRKPTKKLLTLLCMLPLSASLHAATPQIGVAMSAFDDNWLTILRSAIAEEAKKEGAAVQMEDGKNEVGTQLNQIQNFTASSLQAIIVNPVDSTAVQSVTDEAKDADIPLVYVNREPANIATLPDNQAFVGSSEIEGGTLQAKEVCRLLNGKGNVLIMQGDLAQQSAVLRTQAVEDVFKKAPCDGIKVVDKQVAKWTRTGGNNLMTNWLSTNLKFDAVVANNDEMALGAIQALKASNRDMKTVVVAGIDATVDALNAMKAGDLDVTVFQDANAQGHEALVTAMKLVKGEKVDKRVLIPYQLVTSANMNQFMK